MQLNTLRFGGSGARTAISGLLGRDGKVLRRMAVVLPCRRGFGGCQRLNLVACAAVENGCLGLGCESDGVPV